MRLRRRGYHLRMAPQPRDVDRTPDDVAGLHARARLLDDRLRELRRESERVQHDIDEARADWERKRADRGVPGARPHEDSPGDPLNQLTGDWEGTSRSMPGAGQD